MEEKESQKKTGPNDLPSKYINDDFFNELDSDSLDLFDEEMGALIAQNKIQNNSPKKKVVPKRAAKAKGKGKKGEPVEEKASMDFMSELAVDNESLLAAEQDLLEEIKSSNEREKKLKTFDYSSIKDLELIEMAKELDDLDERLERELTINFFKTEFITENKKRTCDLSKLRSFDMSEDKLIDFLQTGLLDELIMICEPEELNIIFEWILFTLCSHGCLEIMECAYNLLEQILSSPELKVHLNSDFSLLSLEKLARSYFGYDVKTSDRDILVESRSSKRKQADFRSLEINAHPSKSKMGGNMATDESSVYSRKHVTPRAAGLRNRIHATESISTLPPPKKEYETLNPKTSPNTSISSMDVEEGRGVIVLDDDEGMMVEKVEGGGGGGEVEENSSVSLGSLIEIPDFPLQNFYYFIKFLRACVQHNVFKFDDDEFMKLLQFCYASLISAKHLGSGFSHLPFEIREIIAGIWKIAGEQKGIPQIAKMCKRLVSNYSSDVAQFRFTVYNELVVQTPHVVLKDSGFSVRNYFSVLLLKNVVVKRIDLNPNEQSVDASKGILSLYKEVAEILRRFIFYISPETNINHKKSTEFDWQYCVSVLFANSITFPQIPRHSEVKELDPMTKLIMAEMRNIIPLIEKWESLLNDNGNYEMQTKTKLFMLKIDYVNYLKDLDEFIADPTVDQINKQNKQQPITQFFKSPTKNNS